MTHYAKEIITTVLLVSIIIPIGFSMLFNNPIDCYRVIYDVNPNELDTFVYTTFTNNSTLSAEYIVGQYVNETLIGQIVNRITFYTTNTTGNIGDSTFEIGIFDYTTENTIISFGTFDTSIIIPNQINAITFDNFNSYQLQEGNIVGVRILNSDSLALIDVLTQDAFITNIQVGGELASIHVDGSKYTELDFIDTALTLSTFNPYCQDTNTLILLIPLIAISIILIIILVRALSDRD